MRKDSRQKVIENYEHRIRKYQRDLEIIKALPLKKILHISYPTCHKYLVNGKIESSLSYGGYVVVPLKFNLNTIRCHVLAIELPCWDSEKINNCIRERKDANTLKKYTYHSYRFMAIKSWKEFDVQDSGLYVNWAYLSEEIKALMTRSHP